MTLLQQHHIARIEEIVGRPLVSEELMECDELHHVSISVVAVARIVAAQSRQLALKYLLALVPGQRLGVALTFLEHVVEGGGSPSEWRASLPTRSKSDD
jgi:hypothetical protein